MNECPSRLPPEKGGAPSSHRWGKAQPDRFLPPLRASAGEGWGGGIDTQHVPFKGASQQLADTAGKHVTYTFASIGASLPFIHSNKLRPIGVTSLTRSPALPDVPAIAEDKPLGRF